MPAATLIGCPAAQPGLLVPEPHWPRRFPAPAATMRAVQVERSRASQAMDAYADGDSSAFADVYDELSPRLYAYVRRMTRVDSVAQDIVQQCFLNLHHARSRFVQGSHVEPWAFAIARRLTIDWARLEKRSFSPGTLDGVPSKEHGPEADAHQSALLAAVRTELESVPEKLREAFLLVRLEGFSTAEAAEVLGTSAMAVKIRAHRAGVLLRSRLSRFRGKEASNE